MSEDPGFPPILRSQRLQLSPLELDDADELFSLFSDPEVTWFLDIDPMNHRDQAVDLLEHFARSRDRREEARWAIRIAGEPPLIGTASLCDLDRVENRADFGVVLGRPWWKMGYASEAMRCVLTWAFDVLKVNRVESLIFAANTASRAMVTQVGMKQEGILREHGYVRGQYLDDVIYSVLLSEWRARG